MRAVVLAMALGLTAGAASAQTQEPTFFTVTYVEVGPALAKQAVPVLKTYRDAGRKDAGNASFELLQRIDRPNQFVVLGAWSDQKAFEVHSATAATKQANEKIAPLQAAPSDTRTHNALAVAAPKTPGALYAVTHVDVIPPQKDNGVAAVKQLAEDSRKQQGNVRFDAWQQTNRPNHFTVVEAWTDRKGFDGYEMAAATREFRKKLVTMTGALYDQRLYAPVK